MVLYEATHFGFLYLLMQKVAGNSRVFHAEMRATGEMEKSLNKTVLWQRKRKGRKEQHQQNLQKLVFGKQSYFP